MNNKIRVLLLRTNKVDPDPRVEKEVNSLLENENVEIEILAWDRSCNYRYHKDVLKLDNGFVVIHRMGINAGWGVGIRKNAFAYIKYAIRTSKWLMKHHREYDVIHACDLQTVLPSLIPIRLYKKKIVYDIYDYFSDTAHGNKFILKLARRFETSIINNADATIICSEQREEQIKPAVPKRMIVVHNAPSKKQIQTNSNGICKSDSNLPRIIYVGNLVEDRCIRELIEAASRCPNIEFHIGGMGSLSDYVKEASRKLNNLYFYGKLQYSDVLALEEECDIMVAFYDQNVPNHKYAAPNKFYEALGLGKPLIMFHHTGVDEVIDKYNLGITVDQNVDSIVCGINELLLKRNEWNNIANKAKKLFAEEYCWEIMGDRLNQLYNQISEE